MSDQGEHIEGSSALGSGSIVGDNQELPVQGKPSRAIKIPCKLILDLMLEALSFPKARYDLHTNAGGLVSAIVTFYVSARVPGNLLQAVKLGGVEDTDSEIAEESAAKEAIRYVEAWENIEVQDLNYNELKYVQEIKKKLEIKLKAATEFQANLQQGLNRAASRMVSFAYHLKVIAHTNRALERSDAPEEINEVFSRFEGVASDLRHAGKKVQMSLKKIAKLQRFR